MMQDFDLLILKTTAIRHSIELSVLHAVVHEPVAGLAVAKEADVSDVLFTDAAMLAWWRACKAAGGRGNEAVAKLAVDVMREECIPGWSADKAERFIRHFSPIVAPDIQRIVIGIEAAKLIAIHKRMREATDHQIRANYLLSEAW